MSNDDWRFAGLFHNLSVEDAIRTKYVSIVSSKDTIAHKLRVSHPGLCNLVDGFIDQFGCSINPCLLITRHDVPSSVLTYEAIVAFRNALSISAIVKAWQELFVMNVPNTTLIYSDYFDFYPISISKDGDWFSLHPLSGLDINTSINFHGQPSPELDRKHQKGIIYDETLFLGLISIWEKYFVKKSDRSWQNRALFRSLEMAYHASAIPIRNEATIYDYGTCLSLWVSAMEILAHPNTSVGKKHVIDLIGKTTFHNPKLNQKRYIVSHKRVQYRVNLVQKLCAQLYAARNKFLHGNRVSEYQLYPFKNINSAPLSSYAPLIFKTALIPFVKKWFSFSLNNCTTSQFIRTRRFEDALLTSKGNRS